MKNIVNEEAIRRLQKDGEYRFPGLTREQTKKAASTLATETMAKDRKNGIKSSFGIARDAFGCYYAVQIND
ncbi:MAG: hypothetical protein IJT23_08920 [Clostridia bacterium]|nr:hypothetical protein [Clostridia bacterium]